MLPADQVRGPESPEAASSWETCGHMPGAGAGASPRAAHQKHRGTPQASPETQGSDSDGWSRPQPQVTPGAGKAGGPICGGGRAEGALSSGYPPKRPLPTSPLPTWRELDSSELGLKRHRGWPPQKMGWS